MFSPKKFPLFIFIFLVFSLFLAGTVLAKLEVPLPQVGSQTLSETPILSDYIKYIFSFIVGFSGLVIFGVLIYGGMAYVSSAGNTSTQKEAKDRIYNALLGLAVIFASWLILTTINPHLIKIVVAPPDSELVPTTLNGVYLCKTADNPNDPKNCFGPYISDSDSLEDEIFNEATYVRIDGSGEEYVVVLHEDEYGEGECEIITSSGPIRELGKQASSISIIRKGSGGSGQGVMLYKDKDYKGESWGWFTTDQQNLDKAGDSIKIDGNYVAILFENTDYRQYCQVFRVSRPSLEGEPIEKCYNDFNFFSDKGCFRSLMVIPK